MKVIYMLISPSGRVYVGKSVRFGRRLGQHRRRSRKKKTFLYNAVRKHSWGKFIKLVLQIFPYDVTVAEMSVRERYFIKKYRAFERKYGYNLTEGGDGAPGYKHTDEAKKNLQTLVRKSGKMKKVYAKNVKTEEEYLFESRAEAMRELRRITGKNISRFHITDCCKGVQKTHAGFIFKYV